MTQNTDAVNVVIFILTYLDPHRVKNVGIFGCAGSTGKNGAKNILNHMNIYNMNKNGKKVIITSTKSSGLGWNSVIREGKFGKIHTAIDSGKVTGKITNGSGPLFKVQIDDPWRSFFIYTHLAFAESDLIFVSDDFLSDDDIAI